MTLTPQDLAKSWGAIFTEGLSAAKPATPDVLPGGGCGGASA
jgi:hypothetical protein